MYLGTLLLNFLNLIRWKNLLMIALVQLLIKYALLEPFGVHTALEGLGITLLISKIDVQKSFYTTNWPVMMIASGMLFYFIIGNDSIGRYEGLILFSFLIILSHFINYITLIFFIEYGFYASSG